MLLPIPFYSAIPGLRVCNEGLCPAVALPVDVRAFDRITATALIVQTTVGEGSHKPPSHEALSEL